MKAQIFTIALLMVVALTTNGQTSRRGDRDNTRNTSTEEKRNNDNKQKTTSESRTSERKPDAQQPAAETPQSSRRRQEQTRDNSNTNNNTQTSQDKKDNQYRPVGNQRVNERKQEESRRPEHNTRVQNTPPPKREYVRIEHSNRRVVTTRHPKNYRPQSVQVRREYHPYRVPVRREVVWSIEFRNNFRVYYPEVRYWRYDVGYRIPAVSAYDAYDYIGDVARVYGKAYEVYYEYKTDDYYIYFGDYYPYHDFSVIVPGHEARKINRRPERVFRRSHIEVTGYITEFDNRPEMIIRNARQLDIY